MQHRTTQRFRRCYDALPENVRELASKNFLLLKQNPRHPSLQLKKIGELWSVRVGRGYRALALDDRDGLTWVWIGNHAEYDRLLR